MALVQNLHRRRCRADLHHCMHQVVRHAVVVAVERHMIIDVDSRACPLAHVEALRRQFAQRGLIKFDEE